MAHDKLHRLRGFDYRGLHRYFLTKCTFQRQPAFRDDGFSRDAVAQLFQSGRATNFAVTAYCLMPDHVHLLIEGTHDGSDMRSFVKSWNTTVAFRWKRTHALPLWQSRYYERVLRDGNSPLGVARYIVMNPVRAGLVKRVEDYPWTGSERYGIDEILEATEWRP